MKTLFPPWESTLLLLSWVCAPLFLRHPWLNHTIVGAGGALLCETGKDLPSLTLPKSSQGSWNPRAKWFHPLLVCWQLSYFSEPCQRCLRGVWIGWISPSRFSFLARYQRKLQTPKLILAPIHSRRKSEYYHHLTKIVLNLASNTSEKYIVRKPNPLSHNIIKYQSASLFFIGLSCSIINIVPYVKVQFDHVCMNTFVKRLQK